MTLVKIMKQLNQLNMEKMRNIVKKKIFNLLKVMTRIIISIIIKRKIKMEQMTMMKKNMKMKMNIILMRKETILIQIVILIIMIKIINKINLI